MDLDLGLTTIDALAESPTDWSSVWAASGAMSLSGRVDQPPLPVPVALVRMMVRAADAVGTLSEQLGSRVDLDGPALLGERAALAKVSRRGSTCCGGSTRLVRAADDWMAVSLARDADIELLPAWLGGIAPYSMEDAFAWVAASVVDRGANEVVERAALLGLPVARLGEVGRDRPLIIADRLRGGGGGPPSRLSDVVVVDLSSLWAGPLCANVLGLGGARVIKVEGSGRADGARLGPASFFDLLHGGHEAVSFDLRTDSGVRLLRRLIERADVVIEASRPRALAQLGIDPRATDGPRVWLSITGHGRDEPGASRVAFGDDAAVAGGLVTRDAAGPCFCCDAVADPASGMVAAAAVLDRLQAGGRWLVDVALSRTAAWATGGPLTGDGASGEVAPPRHREISARAPAEGEHTDRVVQELGLS